MTKSELTELEELLEKYSQGRLAELAKKAAEMIRQFVEDEYIVLEP